MTAADRGAWRRLDRRMLLIHPIQEIPRALPALLAAFVAGNGSGQGPHLDRRRARHHARIRVLALVHDALPRDRGPRRGQLGPLPAPRARRLARPHPDRRRHRAGDAPAARARPRRDRNRALRPRARAAACGSTASPRPRPPRCATELLHRRPRRRRPPTPPRTRRAPAAAQEPEIELARLDSSWVRYAPFTLSGVVSVGVVLGFLLNLANEAHFDPENWGPARHLADSARPRAGRARRRWSCCCSRSWPSWWPRPSATRSPSGTSASPATPAGPCTSRAGSSPPARRRSRSAGCTAPRSASRCSCAWSGAPA